MKLNRDGSSKGKIKLFACLFMGLGHIVCLKQRAKGILYALVEVCFLLSLPLVFTKLYNMVTLGFPQPNLPIKQCGNSVFMLIDGILVLMIVIIFFVIYFLSVKNAEEEYKHFCIFGYTKSSNNPFFQMFQEIHFPYLV